MLQFKQKLRVVEAETIQKNGRSLQSRKNKYVKWLFYVFCVITFPLFVFSCVKKPTSAELIERPIWLIEKDSLETATYELNKISEQDSLFQQAQLLRGKIDSLQRVKRAEYIIRKFEQERTELKRRLNRELELINAGIDFSTYRGSYDRLEAALSLFETWRRLVEEGDNSRNVEIQNLSAQLRNSASRIQVREFPLLRQEYTRLLARELWIDDIHVSVSGRGNTILHITGSRFVLNRNIQEYANRLHMKVWSLKFRQLRFSSSRREQERGVFTYYSLRPSDIRDADVGSFWWMTEESRRNLQRR